MFKKLVSAFYILKYIQVVQNGRKVKVNIVKTEEKGWGKQRSHSSRADLLILHTGVFAGERMEAGTFLGMYSGELVTEATGESRKYVFAECCRLRLLMTSDIQAVRRIWPNLSL